MQLIAWPGTQYSFPYIREPRLQKYKIYFTRTTSRDAVWEPVQSRHACDGEQLKTKTHMGVQPRGVKRIHQAQAELSGSSMALVSSRKLLPGVRIIWTGQVKEGLEQCWSREPIRLLV